MILLKKLNIKVPYMWSESNEKFSFLEKNVYSLSTGPAEPVFMWCRIKTSEASKWWVKWVNDCSL